MMEMERGRGSVTAATILPTLGSWWLEGPGLLTFQNISESLILMGNTQYFQIYGLKFLPHSVAGIYTLTHIHDPHSHIHIYTLIFIHTHLHT